MKSERAYDIFHKITDVSDLSYFVFWISNSFSSETKKFGLRWGKDEVHIPETPKIDCFWIVHWRSRACAILHLSFVYFLFDSKSFFLSKLILYTLIISCRNDKWSVSMLSQLSQGGHENHQEGGKYMHTKRRCRYKINVSMLQVSSITTPLW